jgi:hypothetical protein
LIESFAGALAGLERLDGSVTTIRDFRFSRYALEGAEIARLG